MTALLLGALLARVQPAQALPAASDAPSPVASDVPSPVAPVGRMPATLAPVPPDAAVIRNSGSTNTAGYTVIVSPDGSALVRQYDSVERKLVGTPQVRWLFLKLREAAPLDALPVAHCMKSASFGSTTTIAWNDRTSGDLSCSDDPVAMELARTIGVIVRDLEISTFPHTRRLHTL